MISLMRQEIIRGQPLPRYNGMEFKTQVEFLFPPMMLDASTVESSETFIVARLSQEIKSQAAVVECDLLPSQRAGVDILILQIHIITIQNIKI